MLVAAGETARTLARDICPASSTKSTSTAFAISSRAHSHADPAATFAEPLLRAASTSSLLSVWVTVVSSHESPAFAF